METSANSDPERPRPSGGKPCRNAAFSLVEIALALGIIAFAVVSVFGLMPIGMNTFRQAIDLSVGSQIAQQVVNEAQQADFDTLTGVKTLPDGSTNPVSKQIRYFDNQGSELASATAPGVVYQVNTRVVPAVSVPSSANPSGVANGNVATVTVQVVNNPANQPLTPDNNGLWTSTTTRPVTTFSTYVARTSSVPAP